MNVLYQQARENLLGVYENQTDEKIIREMERVVVSIQKTISLLKEKNEREKGQCSICCDTKRLTVCCCKADVCWDCLDKNKTRYCPFCRQEYFL